MLQVAMENFQHNTGIHCFDFIFWFVCIWEKFTNMNLLTNEATLSTTVNKVSPGKLCAFFFGMHIRSQQPVVCWNRQELWAVWLASGMLCVTVLRCGSFETKLQVYSDFLFHLYKK